MFHSYVHTIPSLEIVCVCVCVHMCVYMCVFTCVQVDVEEARRQFLVLFFLRPHHLVF